MTTIQTGTDLCTVIVTLDADADVLSQMESHAREGLRRFAHAEGFVSGALHVSHDGGRIVQYLQWVSEQHYRTCMDDPAWEALPSTKVFMDFLRSGQGRIDVRLFSVIATSVCG